MWFHPVPRSKQTGEPQNVHELCLQAFHHTAVRADFARNETQMRPRPPRSECGSSPGRIRRHPWTVGARISLAFARMPPPSHPLCPGLCGLVTPHGLHTIDRRRCHEHGGLGRGTRHRLAAGSRGARARLASLIGLMVVHDGVRLLRATLTNHRGRPTDTVEVP